MWSRRQRFQRDHAPYPSDRGETVWSAFCLDGCCEAGLEPMLDALERNSPIRDFSHSNTDGNPKDYSR